MSQLLSELIENFSTGKKPNGDDFRELIEASFNNNIEIYNKVGIQNNKIKIFADSTLVKNNDGQWDINYSNVGYTSVICVLSAPVQNNQLNSIRSAYLASVVHAKNNTTASGLAFNAAIKNYDSESDGVSLAYTGTEIQVLVIGY